MLFKQHLSIGFMALIALLLSGAVYWQGTVRHISVGYIDEDQSTQSRTLIRYIDATPQIQLVPYANANDLVHAISYGVISGGIHIPNQLEEKIRNGKPAKITLFRDASNVLIAGQIYASIASIVAQESARLSVPRLLQLKKVNHLQAAKEMSAPLRLDTRTPQNPYFNYFTNLLPGLFLAYFQLALMLIGASLAFINQSTWQKKLLYQILQIVPWVLLPSMVAHFTQIAPFGQSAFYFIVSLLIGLAIATLIRKPTLTVQLLLGLNAPAFLFSGYTFPTWAFPDILQKCTQFLPLNLFLELSFQTNSWVFLGLYGIVSLIIILLFANKYLPHPPHLHNSRFIKEPGVISLLILAPLLYMVLYGSVYSNKQQLELPIIVNAQANSYNSRLIRELDAHPKISILQHSKESPTDPVAILTLPPQIQQNFANGKHSEIQLQILAKQFLVASDLQKSINEVLNTHMLILAPLKIDDKTLSNASESYGDFMLPGLGILILHQLLLILTAFATSQRKNADPTYQKVSRILLRNTFLSLLFTFWALLWVKIGLSAFQVPTQITWFPLITGIYLGLFTVSLLGTLLGLWIPSGLQALQWLGFSSYPFFFLSGISWPSNAFPYLIDLFANTIPLRPLIWITDRSIRYGLNFFQLQASFFHLILLATVFTGLLTFWIHLKPRSIQKA